MAELKLSVSEMKELLDKMSALGLQKITVAQGDFTFKAEARQPAQTVCVTPDAQIIPAVPAAEAPAQAVSQKAEAPAGNVSVGTRVKKGDVLFIIESMKLMNEITSEFDGEVAEILAEDGQGVEYGQPIMVIR